MYALGLDWISKKDGWAYCTLTSREGQTDATFGSLETDAIGDAPLVRDAAKIVVDAPIGLPDDADQGCKARPCDLGAKKWIGTALQSSVFAPPYAGELTRWRNAPGAERLTIERRGHFRGLLPAIDSADRIFTARPDGTLESHPELVFAALVSKYLPAYAKKDTLIGLLARLGLIAKWGVRVEEEAIAGWGKAGADNFVDAAAMAIVADEWLLRGDICVITDADGTLKQMSSHRQHGHLMAIITPSSERPPAEVPDLREVAEVARTWTVRAD